MLGNYNYFFVSYLNLSLVKLKKTQIMKTLKMSMLALLMLVGNFVWAQQPAQKTAEERATNHSKRMTSQLGLSADQSKSVYSLALTHAQQQDADRAKYQNDREGMKNARKQNMDTFEAGLAKVLTADQMTKYNQMKADDKAKRQQGGGPRGGE